IEIDEPLPTIEYYLAYIKNQGWQSSKNRTVQTIRAEIKLSNGNNIMITTSTWYYKNRIAQGLLWYGEIPDWRNIGDKNPHPNQIFIMDLKEVEELLEYCNM